MVVSYTWLKEYFDKDLPSPKELGALLNTRAFEVEGIEEIGNDHAIDIDVLPNRAHDCLGHYGIAREISVLSKIPLKEIEFKSHDADFETKRNVTIESPVCTRYILREITGIVNGPSPDELRVKLETIGQKSINTIVDITNIVMYELGQPMHAFDAEKVSGDIVVRPAREGEKITTLDKKEVELDAETAVIADQSHALAIAGIKGGNSAEVDEKTTSILLEAANFNSTAIRKATGRVGIKTDSSKRFENDISPTLVAQAMERATELILKYAKDDAIQVSNVVDVYPRQPKHPFYVGVGANEVRALLGTDISDSDIERVLNELNFTFEKKNIRETIVEEARSALGKPYVRGASVLFGAPDEFDCSSLTAYICARAGIAIPRISVDQYVYMEHVDESVLQPGDFIFSNQHFGNIYTESQEFMKGTEVPEGIDHVGVYVGDGKVIHATAVTGDVVEEVITESERFKDIIGYGRVVGIDEDRYVITVPDERLDIRIPEDLIEEIGRVYGYEHVIPREISSINREPQINSEYYFNTVIRKSLAQIGFSEIVTTTFVEKGIVETLKPIAEDRAYLRDSLKDGMERALEMNLHNADLFGMTRIHLFEIGKVFAKDTEALMLSLAVSKGKPKSHDILQEAIDVLADVFGTSIDTDIKEGDLVTEINLSALYKTLEPRDMYPSFDAPLTEQYTPFSTYPFMLRDVSVWVPDEVAQEDVVATIEEKAGELRVRTTLFDEYKKDGRTSYAFRLVFQSHDKTLTDEEINPIMDGVYSALQDKGWEIR